MNQAQIVQMARHAMPLMTPEAQREVESIVNALEPARTANAGETLDEFTQRAGRAFEKDMQPVCKAIVSALQEGDTEALKGLRALLPHLLEDVARDETLSDLLAYQLGRAFLDGYLEESGREER